MCVQYNAVRLWNMDSYKTLQKPNPVLWEKMLPKPTDVDDDDDDDEQVMEIELQLFDQWLVILWVQRYSILSLNNSAATNVSVITEWQLG